MISGQVSSLGRAVALPAALGSDEVFAVAARSGHQQLLSARLAATGETIAAA